LLVIWKFVSLGVTTICAGVLVSRDGDDDVISSSQPPIYSSVGLHDADDVESHLHHSEHETMSAAAAAVPASSVLLKYVHETPI